MGDFSAASWGKLFIQEIDLFRYVSAITKSVHRQDGTKIFIFGY